MAKYIVRGQMWLRHDGQRFYPGAVVEIEGDPPLGWEKVGEKKGEDGAPPSRPPPAHPPAGKKS